MRWCRMPGCRGEAVATCSFNYATRQVWISELRDDPDPATQDLCGHHASRFTAPVGWDLTDVRAPGGFEPDAAIA